MLWILEGNIVFIYEKYILFKIFGNLYFLIIFRNKYILLCINIKNLIIKSNICYYIKIINIKNIYDINIYIKGILVKRKCYYCIKIIEDLKV